MVERHYSGQSWWLSGYVVHYVSINSSQIPLLHVIPLFILRLHQQNAYCM